MSPDEVIAAPCVLPEGVEPAPRRNLISAGGLEIPVPSFISLIGFVASWAMVGIIVYSVYLIAGG